ncbi:MAG: hypothetical protein HS113_07965 [Verrucomicrobiales bacterium]|nr:hypothetical protein [Verrucomicrobiales bacterium]
MHAGNTPTGGTGEADLTRGATGWEVGAAQQEPRLHRWADRATEGLLLGMLVFSPWALAGWPSWSVWTMNVGGYLLGLLWLVKEMVRRQAQYRPDRWTAPGPGWRMGLLGVLTLALLSWCLVSALNGRAVVDVAGLRLEEQSGWIPWLPHSYDAPSTWFQFWSYLGLAGVFWAAMDWVSLRGSHHRAHRTRHVRRRARPGTGADDGVAGSRHELPHRLKKLLWVACLNGAAVALIGIFSTLDNPAKVLWLVPHETRQGNFFGPFWYRNHGAQYLNLLWPLCLGLYQASFLQAAERGRLLSELGRSPSLLLIPCLVLMSAAPFVLTGRGGSLIAGVVMVACVPVLCWSGRKLGKGVVVGLLVLPVGLALGLALAWKPLTYRFFRGFVCFPTHVEVWREGFTLRTVFEVPRTWRESAVTMAGLSESRTRLLSEPGSVSLSLRREGRLEVRIQGEAREQALVLVTTNAVLAEPDRAVELVLVQQAQSSTVYLNGSPLPMRAVTNRAGFRWPERLATRYLWVGRGAGGSRIFNARLEAVTLVGRALPPAELAPLVSETPRTGRGIGLGFGRDAWEALKPAPVHHLRPHSLSPSMWLAEGLAGRQQFYEQARGMLADYPAAFGAGPGTFGNLYKVFLQNAQATDTWHVHNDYLETRLEFGWLGSVLIYAAFLLALWPLAFGGGGRVPSYLLAFVAIALAGCLVQARFDWILQAHPLLFLMVLLCGLVSAIGRADGARP